MGNKEVADILASYIDDIKEAIQGELIVQNYSETDAKKYCRMMIREPRSKNLVYIGWKTDRIPTEIAKDIVLQMSSKFLSELSLMKIYNKLVAS